MESSLRFDLEEVQRRISLTELSLAIYRDDKDVQHDYEYQEKRDPHSDVDSTDPILYDCVTDQRIATATSTI